MAASKTSPIHQFAPAFPAPFPYPARAGIARGSRLLALLVVLLGLLIPWPAMAGTWAPLAHTAPGSVGLMLLLSDGTVMVENNDDGGTYGPAWYRLTPSSTGSYVNGTWSTLP